MPGNEAATVIHTCQNLRVLDVTCTSIANHIHWSHSDYVVMTTTIRRYGVLIFSISDPTL